MAGVKLRLKVDTAKLTKIIAKKKKLLRANVQTVLFNDAIPHLIELIMAGYDGLGDRMDLLPEDPTNPANWREEFRDLLQDDLVETIAVEANKITFGLGNRDILGYTASGEQAEGDNAPLHWLVFYFEGLIGEWGFIDTALYQQFRSPEGGVGKFKAGGKFGSGFMISKIDFFDEGWDKVIPWSSVRHPFSGFSPLDIFTEAIREFSLRPFINTALKATAEGREL